ncbi:hypothetical protein CcrC1_gp327 [Caulobacter phage C1]|nr:hypothetical protein CcrC1_gp327 [Caulobacter phage C1]UTU08556.1 hypothetical protein CcrC2_gp328 [Caulobacter phage C2]UTU09072.1 hypothetical protein CcrJ4_gp323 [Caulobacter phage J4]UTU09631.1 hypothetical protein CcrBL47_gp345 [Caulobacter phage BL47]UTU10189.1 hypothetical protein CcrRB23_gp327 [Caulobacter phage RB23]WGN97223.1 hypothetical protein [Bertelyvirus sp.]
MREMKQRKPSILRWEYQRGVAFGYLGEHRVASVYAWEGGIMMKGRWRWRIELPPAPGRNASGKGLSESYCRQQAANAIQHFIDTAGLAIKAPSA